MPAPRGSSDIPTKNRHAGLTKAKRKGDAVEFSEDDFAKWVTGAHKRRVERQRTGHKQAADMIKAEKAADRREQNQKVREIVKQHFGDVNVDKDGRIIVSGTQNNEFQYSDSDEEFEAKQKREFIKRQKKMELLAEELRLKQLPKWAQNKKSKNLELQKEDSIVKEQNESFIRAQYSFNSGNNMNDITSVAEKNKFVKNLKISNQNEKKELQRQNLMPTIMNFENDDSVVVVETSNLDQANLSSAIISRRAQRDLAKVKRDVIDTTRMGRRSALVQSTQPHTLMTDSDLDSDNDELLKKKKIKLVKKTVANQQQKIQKKDQKKNQNSNNEEIDPEYSRLQELQARFTNRSLKKDGSDRKNIKNNQKKGPKKLTKKQQELNKQLIARYTKPVHSESEDEREFDDSVSEFEDDDDDIEIQYYTETEEEEEDEEEDGADRDEDVEDMYSFNAPQRRNRQQPIINESDDDDDDDDENSNDEWDVVEETFVSTPVDDVQYDSNDLSDDETVYAKADKAHIKRLERETIEKQRKQAEIEEKRRQEEEKKAKLEKLEHQNKRQKLNENDKKNSKITAELSRDRNLAASIAADLINNEFSVAQAQKIHMADASAWFMLPKPQVWTEADERKKKLLEQRKKTEQIQDGTWDFAADKEKRRKLTNLETMELDPTYGWEEGEGSSSKDLGDIFGIPAASMGGRYRKKPLSDKNKKKSSDSRKAKKAEKQREKDQKMALSFETGFADSNVKGREIKWDDSSDDDSFKVYSGGAKFKENKGKNSKNEPKNRKERKKIEAKKKIREENLHKRGKMVTGKYYFGTKDSAVNM